jgi:superfamily II DNA or RNA helicase
MIRSASAVVRKSEICSLEAYEQICELLSIPNPEYISKVRFGKGYGLQDTPKDLYFISEETEYGFLLPRNFVKEHPALFSVKHVQEDLYDGVPVDKRRYKFVKPLRPYQIEFFADEPEIMTEDDMLLEAKCGHGKTVLGAYMVAYWQRRAIVMVPEYAIAKQWLSTFARFTPHLKCEMTTPAKFKRMCKAIEEKKCDIDVLIMSFDLFDARLAQFPPSFCLYFGATVLDEAHLMGAPTYGHVLDTLPTRKRLALTATFRRSDGMDRILKYHFGRHFKMPNRFPAINCYPIDTGFEVKALYKPSKFPIGAKAKKPENMKLFEDFAEECGLEIRQVAEDLMEFDLDEAHECLEQLVHSKRYPIIEKLINGLEAYQYNISSTVDTYIAEVETRNRDLLALALHAVRNGRTVLFLSKRKAALKRFHQLFLQRGIKSALYTAETSSDALLEYMQMEAQIIFAIMQKANIGLDIERLDTLVLHIPISDFEQAAGRVTRLEELFFGKQSPMMLYPIDRFRPYVMMYRKGKKLCTNANYMGLTPVNQMMQIIGEKRYSENTLPLHLLLTILNAA